MYPSRGLGWRSWLRHCPPRWKAAGSISDSVIDIILLAPGVDLASNRNDYQEYFLRAKGGRCVGLTTLPLSCAHCLEIWKPQTSGALRACPGLYRGFYTLLGSPIKQRVKQACFPEYSWIRIKRYS
jgi:hypothetical protein